MSELKPCPICGSPGLEKEYQGYPEPLVGCLSRVCPMHDSLMLRSKWQHRPIEDALRAENARLQADLRRISLAALGHEDDSAAAAEWVLGHIERAQAYDGLRARVAELEAERSQLWAHLKAQWIQHPDDKWQWGYRSALIDIIDILEPDHHHQKVADIVEPPAPGEEVEK